MVCHKGKVTVWSNCNTIVTQSQHLKGHTTEIGALSRGIYGDPLARSERR
jgi:hypothetical protein